MGIVVSQKMVLDYIYQATDNNLKPEDYARIRSSFTYQGRPLEETTLLEILADEIKISMAYNAQLPIADVIPSYTGNLLAALSTTECSSAAKLRQPWKLTRFLDQVTEPTDAEITALFDQGKEKFPNQDEPGSVGFRLSHRAKLAWLELDYATVEASVPEVTDEEIQNFYDENRETRFKTPVIPDEPLELRRR